MPRTSGSLPLQVLAVLLLGLVASSSAANCAPGQGIAKTDLASFLGSFLGLAAATPSGCSPCAKAQASRGGENAECVLCTPLLSSPNADQSACDCLPGTYAPSAPSATTAQRTCIACGGKAISTTRNAASCHACPEGARATSDNKCGCEPGYVATGLGALGVTGCR